jgi:hypothetical protein
LLRTGPVLLLRAESWARQPCAPDARRSSSVGIPPLLRAAAPVEASGSRSARLRRRPVMRSRRSGYRAPQRHDLLSWFRQWPPSGLRQIRTFSDGGFRRWCWRSAAPVVVLILGQRVRLFDEVGELNSGSDAWIDHRHPVQGGVEGSTVRPRDVAGRTRRQLVASCSPTSSCPRRTTADPPAPTSQGPPSNTPSNALAISRSVGGDPGRTAYAAWADLWAVRQGITRIAGMFGRRGPSAKLAGPPRSAADAYAAGMPPTR